MNYMKRALKLAREALGTTSPNPSVGAVLVRDGQLVGEGFTQPPGQSHAEVMALQLAGALARDAVLYTTLEPCCTFGRTAPCTKAIFEAGVSEVHVALKDPNQEVNGKGLAEMEAAGISVHLGEEAEEASLIYEAYNKYVSTGLPFLTAKFACSLDGKIATFTGDSQWITCAEARLQVHQMRRATDAIMVGINTVLCDDPRLTVRNEAGCPVPRQPLRVVLDSQGRMPLAARMFGESGKTLIATTVPESKVDRPSVEAICLPCDRNGQVDINVLLEKLGERGILSLLVEGGSELFGTLFDQQLIDKVISYIAPIIIGGCKAPSPVGGAGVPILADALQLENVTVEQIGSNFKIEGYPLRNP